MTVAGMETLKTFYTSVHFHNASLAEEIGPDVMRVQMDSLSYERSDVGRDAADRLRRAAFDMPVIFARVLDNALEDLGY